MTARIRSSPRSRGRGWLLMAGLAATSVACGASFEALHESDIRFEHCYRLDLDETITPSHRQHCWREWRESYTFGQPGDRIAYADRRVRALRSGDTSRPVLNVGVADNAPRAHEAPAPSNAAASPVPVVPVDDPTKDGGADASRSESTEEAKERACLSTCYDGLESCRDSCKDLECRPCLEDYARCSKRCLMGG